MSSAAASLVRPAAREVPYDPPVTTVVGATLVVGLEIHVELATRTKAFTRAPSPARPGAPDAEPNTLIDPVVLGLPGALPVLNRTAVEMAIRVGLALNCAIAPRPRWDRKSYFYPDLPKNYQISQYDRPLCSGGALDLPDPSDPEGKPPRRIGILRAHLEEDAGKLLHEWPGGAPIDFSIVDLNRAGTPLLEIVTAPDFRAADEVVAFAQQVRSICRFLGASEGVLQKGHMRFEPNINTLLTLSDGRRVATPITEVKNLNSFRALRGAIEHEFVQQPRRFLEDGRSLGPATKSTRGWDDQRGVTVLQREKEDAHDYRYFPDPDLLPVEVAEPWLASLRAALPELPAARARRYRDAFALGAKEAAALVEERDDCLFFEACLALLDDPDGPRREALGRVAANLVLQSGFKRANGRGVPVHALGVAPAQLAGIALLRHANALSAAAADELFGTLCESTETADEAAARLGLLQVTDAGALEAWVDQTLADPDLARAAADVRQGKDAAIGRLVGAAMKRSGGTGDAKALRELLLRRLRG